LGVFLAYQFEKQRDAEAENQRKAAILQDMMTTRNGPDVAFFTAVGDRLTIHLRRYEIYRDARSDPNLAKQYESMELFDERAIYFFYGMFRVARVDFLATKGYVLYPRVWMEEAFARITESVINEFAGSAENTLDVSPIEQAALYHYFGASNATYHTGSKRADTSFPDVFEFNRLLTAAEQSKPPEPHIGELLKAFQNFQRRLRDKPIDSKRLITSFEAIIGLDDYAFNTLFSEWYKQVRSEPPPVAHLPKAPPEDFLSYPLDSFKFKSANSTDRTNEWGEERKRAWQIILDNVPDELKR
jgi:hypothetical protein